MDTDLFSAIKEKKPPLISAEVKPVKISEIRPSQDNPRGPVAEDTSFQRLVDSIDEVGILVPLVVQKLRKPDGHIKYELVDGERRFRAAQALRTTEVPAHI